MLLANISSLSYESHFASRHEDVGPFQFWRVRLDGTVLSEFFRPFDASNAVLIPNECSECGHCGVPGISVRRSGRTVVWMGNPEYRWASPTESLIVFAAEQYQEWLWGDWETLPELSRDEWTSIVHELEIPDWRHGLYTIPDLRSDPAGHRLLQIVAAGLTGSLRDAEIDVEADWVEEIHIGLELPTVPENVIRVYRRGGRWGVLLRERPEFPFGISTPFLSDACQAYVADNL